MRLIGIKRFLKDSDSAMVKKKAKYVREGRYVAEVEVDLHGSDVLGATHLSLEDANRLNKVKEPLRNEEVRTAAQYGRINKLAPETERYHMTLIRLLKAPRLESTLNGESYYDGKIPVPMMSLCRLSFIN